MLHFAAFFMRYFFRKKLKFFNGNWGAEYATPENFKKLQYDTFLPQNKLPFESTDFKCIIVRA